jgi:hypothetical protein
MLFVGIVASGLVSGSFYNGGGASDINTLKSSRKIYITFTAYLTDMHERTCFAPQIKRPPFFTDISQECNVGCPRI